MHWDRKIAMPPEPRLRSLDLHSKEKNHHESPGSNCPWTQMTTRRSNPLQIRSEQRSHHNPCLGFVADITIEHRLAGLYLGGKDLGRRFRHATCRTRAVTAQGRLACLDVEKMVLRAWRASQMWVAGIWMQHQPIHTVNTHPANTQPWQFTLPTRKTWSANAMAFSAKAMLAPYRKGEQ